VTPVKDLAFVEDDRLEQAVGENVSTQSVELLW
jgi:hypothetical protein